jgi:hypothetical protein
MMPMAGLTASGPYQASTQDTLALALQTNASPGSLSSVRLGDADARRRLGGSLSAQNRSEDMSAQAMPHGRLYGFQTPALKTNVRRVTPPVPEGTASQGVAALQSMPTAGMQVNVLDLNRDGTSEKLLSEVDDPRTSLKRFSILTQGQRELFYAKGQSLYTLSSEHHGWQDIALNVRPGYQLVYTYHLPTGGYQLASQVGGMP